jgi:hypothetical protein
LCGFLAFTPGFSAKPSYLAFVFHRSQKYYSRFADACEELRAIVGTNQYKLNRDDPSVSVLLQKSDMDYMGFTNAYEMRGDDTRLPRELRKIKATAIAVTSNRVWLYVDVPGRYAIAWETDYVNPNAMVLTVYGEAAPQRVFFKTNGIPNSAFRTH